MNKKRAGIFLGILALSLMALIGLGLWKMGGPGQLIAALQPTRTAEASSQYQTTSVRRGDLSISISGSGTVVTVESDDLGFATAGTVAVLSAAVGETVTAGQELARLEEIEELELEVENQELAVVQAQKTLDELSSGGNLALAQAYNEMAAAQAALEAAQKSLHLKGDSRCAPSLTQDYYFEWLYAQQRVDEWEGYLNDPDTGYGHDYILERLTPMRKERDQAFYNYTWCQSYTEEEILNSQAVLEVAKAALENKTQAYEDLKASSGISPVALEIAKANLNNAKEQLEAARDNLSGASIVASMDGTVMAVNGEVGDSVSAGTFITLADLRHPKVQVNMDETDLSNFAVGCAANVTFDSLSAENFPGVVTQVSPSLIEVQSVAMVQGLVELEKTQSASGRVLPLGLAANVEVTCQGAEAALYIPSQAVYYADDGSAYVYILNEQGQPIKHTVTVGIKTVASAEIQSGLNEGEKIVLSQIDE